MRGYIVGRVQQPQERDHEDHASCRSSSISLGVGSAYADGGEGPAANTEFTELPGVIPQAPVQNAPAVATARNGQAIQTYVTNSSHGTWLFAPNQNQGNGS